MPHSHVARADSPAVAPHGSLALDFPMLNVHASVDFPILSVHMIMVHDFIVNLRQRELLRMKYPYYYYFCHSAISLVHFALAWGHHSIGVYYMKDRG